MARKLELWEKKHLEEYLDTLDSFQIKKMNDDLNRLNHIFFSMFPSLSRAKVIIRQALLTREQQEKGKRSGLLEAFRKNFQK